MKDCLSLKRATLNQSYSGNLFHSPGKGLVIFFVLAWIIGCSLLVLAMTDCFRQSFFNGRYFLCYILMAGATVSAARICVAYYRSRRLRM